MLHYVYHVVVDFVRQAGRYRRVIIYKKKATDLLQLNFFTLQLFHLLLQIY